MKNFRVWILSVAIFGLGETGLKADYDDIIAAFETIRNGTVFPVEGRTFDDIEESFGPRRQPSVGGSYDWHRGIDIDGAVGDSVYSVYDGTFEALRYSASAGNYVVIRHSLPNPVAYGPNTGHAAWTSFYSYYMHLDDATVSLVNGWTQGDAISAGQLVGYVGTTGASGGEAYAPHLHFELRFGTSNPLQNQIEAGGLSASDAWFDPHMHPLLLFDPENAELRGASASEAYVQTLVEISSISDPSAEVPQGRYFLYESSLDELPILNRFTIEVLGAEGQILKSHILDFNQRSGYNADSNAALDSRDFDLPYVEPARFPDDAEIYSSRLVIPEVWLGEYAEGYEVKVTATDIWEQSVSTSAVPEAETWQLMILGALLFLGWRKWKKPCSGRV